MALPYSVASLLKDWNNELSRNCEAMKFDLEVDGIDPKSISRHMCYRLGEMTDAFTRILEALHSEWRKET